jgi:transposase-like protein
MSIRVVKRYSLKQEKVQLMLHYYSEGIPAYIICQEFLIHRKTLRRLIDQYEKEKGPLREKKVIRYSRHEV